MNDVSRTGGIPRSPPRFRVDKRGSHVERRPVAEPVRGIDDADQFVPAGGPQTMLGRVDGGVNAVLAAAQRAKAFLLDAMGPGGGDPLCHVESQQVAEGVAKLVRTDANCTKLRVGYHPSITVQEPGWFDVNIAKIDENTVQGAVDRLSRRLEEGDPYPCVTVASEAMAKNVLAGCFSKAEFDACAIGYDPTHASDAPEGPVYVVWMMPAG